MFLETLKLRWSGFKRHVGLDASQDSCTVCILNEDGSSSFEGACDTDPDARLATAMNAELNGVQIEVREALPDRADLLLMADVLYDRSNLPLLRLAQAHAREVLVADSRVTALPDSSYRKIARIEALTIPNLGEFDEYRTAHLFHWQEGTQPD